MLKLILAFAAGLGSSRRRHGDPDLFRQEPKLPERRWPPQGEDKILTAARCALDGVNQPLIL
jgi:hypothetical protein